MEYGHCLRCLFMLSACLLHIVLYIFFINIGCASTTTLYYLSVMYITVYIMSFNSNCRILAAELNYSLQVYHPFDLATIIKTIHCTERVQTTY